MSIFNRKIYNKTKERRFVEIAPETLGENEMVKTETVSFGINRRIGLQGVSIIPGIQQDAWVILSSKKRVMFMAAPENREYIYIYIYKRVMNQTTSVVLKVHTLSNITTNPKRKHFDDPDADWNGRRMLHPNLCVYKPRF